jgi:hypothetical protein
VVWGAMTPLVAGVAVEAAGSIVRRALDHFFPDQEKRAKAEAMLRELEKQPSWADQAAERLQLAQIEVNKAEAARGGFFTGWRPAAGWVCVSGLALQYLIFPMGTWLGEVTGHAMPQAPNLDGILVELLAALLGLGTLRTIERWKGKV